MWRRCSRPTIARATTCERVPAAASSTPTACCEIKELFAPEVITALARLGGRPVGVVASQPEHLGGVLFVDSADKAARFIWLCDAFNIPLMFLADVPGFMIGTEVERQGIIRAGRQDAHRDRRGDGAADLGDRAQGLRGGAVCLLGSRVPSGRHDRPADGRDRGDGTGGCRQRRLLQHHPGDRRPRRADRLHRRTPPRSTRRMSTSSASPRTS